MEMFQYAARLEGGADYDTDEARAFIDRTLSQYVTE